jgi:hypothetical protein
LGEWNYCADYGLQVAGVQHRSNLVKLLPIGFHDEQSLFRAFVICRFDGTGDGDESSAGTKHVPGTLQGRATDGVEHHVDFLGNILESLSVIVDHLLSAELHQEVAIVVGRSRQDMGAAPAGELNREDAHRACAPVYEHALARLQLGTVKQALPGSQRVDRDGRRLHMG